MNINFCMHNCTVNVVLSALLYSCTSHLITFFKKLAHILHHPSFIMLILSCVAQTIHNCAALDQLHKFVNDFGLEFKERIVTIHKQNIPMVSGFFELSALAAMHKAEWLCAV